MSKHSEGESTRHYVEFIYPGLITSNASAKEIGHRDPLRVAVPENCAQFRFFDREVGEIGGKRVESDPFNYSPEYYPGGRLMTREEVEREFAGERILIDNMRINKYDKIVRNRFGRFLSPSSREMVVIPEDPHA